MAFDGITVAALRTELSENLTGTRIYKIAQPEADELMLTIKGNSTQYRLMLSADASLPLVYLTDQNKQSPMSAPNYCMLLRKHVQNARIVSIEQPGLERILQFELEHLDEMGDLRRKKLIVEIMGKHSNLIFVNDDNVIIDSIKHISGMVSSVREVLPGRDYFIPQTQDKKDPIELMETASPESLFIETVSAKAMPCYKAVYTSLTGLSPIVAQEICYRASIDSDLPVQALESDQKKALYHSFAEVMELVKNSQFTPAIYYEKGAPVEFCCIPLTIYDSYERKEYESVSALLQDYYAQKNAVTRIRQRSVDLRKIVNTAYERNVKKYDLQMKQLQDSEKREKYRVYGELLNAYGYSVEKGAKSMEAMNYYDENKMLTVPLDPLFSAAENAKKYFDKYGKLKRTAEAMEGFTKETKAEMEHLESIATSLDIALKEEDLVQIKEELIESGYMKRKGGSRREKITSKPFHYISSDGYHIYVGKNNFQNDELTFKFATGNDWWFHAKGIPGSHVVVKSENEELPDTTFEEAARLAAHYSKAKGQEKVEIDYTQKKNVKKPSGAKPGFVVYYTNYSMMIDSDISKIQLA